ncbi:hypothetical protein ANTRET_LOCUS2484 [Anthophora retusa]
MIIKKSVFGEEAVQGRTEVAGARVGYQSAGLRGCYGRLQNGAGSPEVTHGFHGIIEEIKLTLENEGRKTGHR